MNQPSARANRILRILLTNDDGIYAPGLAAMEHELKKIGEVVVVAPATEQSGVSHSITFLTPLIAQKIFVGDEFRGWAAHGSPADCVKLGLFEFCEERPDLIVSGINGGLNAGINIHYSGTVAAAIEGAFFGINSIAVSLEYDDHARFDNAAQQARSIIEKIVANNSKQGQLFNINIPTVATTSPAPKGVKLVPMGAARYGEDFEKREDPKGRIYYWATNDPPPEHEGFDTDLTALAEGYVTLTPLDYNMTKVRSLEMMRGWKL